MATISPAHDRHHVIEHYRLRVRALRRVAQINSAAFRAYLVDMAGALPATRRFVVHISEGKRADLRGLPPGKRP